MSKSVMMSVEEYLATSFEREPEYVHGELVEKAMPN